MSNHEEQDRKKQPPYIDPALVIDTRLREIERQQAEEKKYQREYNRKQLVFNGLLVLATALLVVTSIVSDILILRYVNLTKQSADAATKGVDAAKSAAETASKQFSLMRDQFRQDQRPYIWMTNLGQPAFIETNAVSHTGQIVWTSHFTNYGKSVAYRVTSRRWLRIGVGGRLLESFGRIPGDKGIPITPAYDGFQTALSSPGITRDQFTHLLTTDDGIEVRWRFEYADSYGCVYETTACFRRLAVGAVQYCDIGNEISDCKKEAQK